MKGVGISIIDEEPHEVLHLAILDVLVNFAANTDPGTERMDLELTVGYLQVDSSLPKTQFPVMIAPLPGDAMSAERPETLKLVISGRAHSEVYHLDKLAAALQPLQIALEQNTLTRLIRFVENSTINGALLHSEVNDEYLASSKGAQQSGPRIFVNELRLHPIKVKITVQLAALTDEPDLQPYHPTRKLVGIAKNLASINNATIKLDALHLNQTNYPLGGYVERLQWHYTMQVLRSIYKVLGSLDFIGNPAEVFSDVGGGFKAFFYEPQKGLVESPGAFVGGVAKGTRDLAGGVAGGVSAGFMGVFSTGFKHVGTLAGGFTLDSQFDYNQQQVRQERSNTSKQGFRQGRKMLADGFISGAAGIVQQPVRGAMSGGASGFVNGLGRGLVGAVTKPVVGVAGFASKWTEGIASDARKLTPNAVRQARQTRVLRIRQPRLITNGVIRVYAPEPALLPVSSPVQAPLQSIDEELD